MLALSNAQINCKFGLKTRINAASSAGFFAFARISLTGPCEARQRSHERTAWGNGAEPAGVRGERRRGFPLNGQRKLNRQHDMQPLRTFPVQRGLVA